MLIPCSRFSNSKLALVMKRPGEESLTYERRYVLFPQDELKPKIGRVAGRVDVPASGVDCKPVTNPSVADKTCAMRLLPGADIEDFLNGSAARRKKQSGRITLELMFEQLKGKPSSVTVKQSSGFAELDEVAIKYAKAASFQTNCVHSPFAMAVGVE